MDETTNGPRVSGVEPASPAPLPNQASGPAQAEQGERGRELRADDPGPPADRLLPHHPLSQGRRSLFRR